MKRPRIRPHFAALLLAAAALAALASVDPGRNADSPPVPGAQARDVAPVATTPALTPPPPARSDAPLLTALADPGSAFRAQPMPVFQDAFQTRSWQQPPAPPKPAPVAKPVAPPLPFAYIGRMEEDGATTVFLRRGDDVLLGQAQTAIDPNYRLETIAADRLVFVYLPLQQQQVLSLGATR